MVRVRAGRARRELNWDYDYFVAKHGPINKTTFSKTAKGNVIRRMPNLVKFRDDPDAMLVMSLEDYDELTGKATKAAIMKQDVVGKHPPVTSVQSAEEGLLVSLDQQGAVDLPLIATLCSKTHEQVVAELGDLVFHDPESERWQTADAYLSGNVRAKLAAALQSRRRTTRAMPKRCRPSSRRTCSRATSTPISALPGFPTVDIQAFAAELFRVALDSDRSRAPAARRGLEHRGGPCGKSIGGGDLRIRHDAEPTAPGSWNSPSI